jgi:hypothetical protein
MIEICREYSKNIKRWRDGTMALRWCPAGMLQADYQFRRVNGHLHLPRLRAELEAHFAGNADASHRDRTFEPPDDNGRHHPRGCGRSAASAARRLAGAATRGGSAPGPCA